MHLMDMMLPNVLKTVNQQNLENLAKIVPAKEVSSNVASGEKVILSIMTVFAQNCSYCTSQRGFSKCFIRGKNKYSMFRIFFSQILHMWTRYYFLSFFLANFNFFKSVFLKKGISLTFTKQLLCITGCSQSHRAFASVVQLEFSVINFTYTEV